MSTLVMAAVEAFSCCLSFVARAVRSPSALNFWHSSFLGEGATGYRNLHNLRYEPRSSSARSAKNDRSLGVGSFSSAIGRGISR
jgi:hypothetical protein